MREIKFRAWANDRMIVPYFFEPTNEGYQCYEDWRELEDGRSMPCEVMQFTGLHDKNGVEIYEGDIVAAKFQPHYVERLAWQGPPDAICKVFWDYNGFRLECVGQDDKRYADFTDFERLEHQSEMMVDMATKHSKVIGNIHESPELLKEQHCGDGFPSHQQGFTSLPLRT